MNANGCTIANLIFFVPSSGVMVLVHGDDRGLVLPPRIADVQAIVVPCGITASSTVDERKELIDSCKQLVDALVDAGIRAEGDYRDNYSPGWKFNHWELKVGSGNERDFCFDI